ncbi:HD domain-containing protein [Yoonia sp. R2331]|uniref:HD domain-containing protein n=1 Tax=Yoonia sp. R2331 TaxID=3237238 RepID=UPI0034E395BF
MTQPLFQELANPSQSQTDRDVVRAILTTGRAAALADTWPDIYRYAVGLLDRAPPALPAPMAARLRFLAEADRLKSTLRATRLCDNSRPENSAEHSWHIALYALVLAEYAAKPVQINRVIQMLLIHDLVEIDAGDVPIHSAAARDTAAQAQIEQKAADRLFGLLPADQCAKLRAHWDEFEASETDDAVFAKSIDRVQPLISNLETGGTSWVDYNVTRAQVDTRVGTKVRRGAPGLWDAIAPRIDAWFAAHT